jgi:hypothetical protein
VFDLGANYKWERRLVARAVPAGMRHFAVEIVDASR